MQCTFLAILLILTAGHKSAAGLPMFRSIDKGHIPTHAFPARRRPTARARRATPTVTLTANKAINANDKQPGWVRKQTERLK